MAESPFGKDIPQFGTAEYQGPASDVCKLCQQPITGQYYRANAAMLCPGCAERVRHQVPQDNHAAFVRAILFGLGGFVAGLVLYAGFIIITDIQIGFVSLAVGWLVGKAMMKGSGGIGGRRYQVAAVLLTYAAVSLSFVPIVIHYARTHKISEAKPAQEQGPASPGAPAGQSQQPGSTNSSSSSSADNRPKHSLAAALGMLTLLGLVSPFLGLTTGFSGIIGLFILFIGMQFAWRITRGIQVSLDGPFQTASPAKA